MNHLQSVAISLLAFAFLLTIRLVVLKKYSVLIRFFDKVFISISPTIENDEEKEKNDAA